MEYITLNDGNKIPAAGFGVFQIPEEDTYQAVLDALEVGYRLIDTAVAYQNEAAVGKAIADSSVDRKDIFVTSKLWVSQFTYEKATKAIDESLQRMNLDYIDLMLLHQPYGDVAGAWKALEEAQAAGKIKSIGVSNFYADQLKNLELMSKVAPAVNQVEVSPWFQQDGEVNFMKHEKIIPEAWAPFAEGKHEIFTNETLKKIGDKYGKTNAQVILRWLLQRGIVSLAKSVHKERMQENFDIFDFELSQDDMKEISTLDKNESQFFDHRDPVAIEGIFGSSLKQLEV